MRNKKLPKCWFKLWKYKIFWTFDIKQVCIYVCVHAHLLVYPYLELIKRWFILLAKSSWKTNLLFSGWSWVSYPIFSSKYYRKRSQITHRHGFRTASLLPLEKIENFSLRNTSLIMRLCTFLKIKAIHLVQSPQD